MSIIESNAVMASGEKRVDCPVVAVVGAGITGLSAAHRLKELNPGVRLHVLEAGPRAGGVLETVRADGYLIESSADSFITNIPNGLELARRLGLEDRLMPTDAAHRRAYVVSRGRLELIPDGLLIMAPKRIWPMMTTRILSIPAKMRMGWEAFVPRGDGEDESLASFAIRRFGRETYDRLIQPLVGGMYTGDPTLLGVKSTMPRFLEMEKNHGSLIRAVRKEAKPAKGEGKGKEVGSGARYGLFASFKEGMSELVEGLCRTLPAGAIQCNSPLRELARAEGEGWSLSVGGSGQPRILQADAVILTAPSHVTAGLLQGVDGELGALLDRIPSTGCAIVSLGYPRSAISHPMKGFGFVVPLVEKQSILSGSFASIKFPGRSPEGTVLIRVFLGGASRPELLEAPEGELYRVAERELAPLLGIEGQPVMRQVVRWPRSMPQYYVGHGDLVASIQRRVEKLPGLELAGNSFQGVGVPQCVRSGEEAAERVLKRVGKQGSQ